MNLGSAIKELRKECGLTQIGLASKAKLSQTALSQIEKGKRPGKNTLKKISCALGVPESLIYIMGLEKEDVSPEKQSLYDTLFPVIKSMVEKLAISEEGLRDR